MTAGQRPIDRISPSRGFWANRDFLKFWGGETVSLCGSQITSLAIPLTGALVLGATPAQMGILSALNFAPFFLLTLFAGVWIDRRRRRPTMIAANVGRGVLLLSIPIAAALGMLRIEWLYAVAFLGGALQVLFELAYQSYVPSLVGRDQLVGANSRLQASASTAQVAGPGLAGLLIEALTAPIALLADAISFLVSALTIAAIRASEPPSPPARRDGIWREIFAGLALIARDARLRGLAGEAMTFNLWHTSLTTLLILYAARDLGIGAGQLGLLLTIGGVGALLGATVAAPFAARIGFGPALTWSCGFACTAPLLIPLATGDRIITIPLLTGAFFLGALGVSASQIFVISLRQGITPPNMLARMNTGYRFFVTGFIPIGSLLTGGLGEWLGLRPAIAICALGVISALLWIVFSPPAALAETARRGHDRCNGGVTMTTTLANQETTTDHAPVRFTGAGLWRGVRATLPLSLGSVISGLIFGILARGAGLSVAEVALMSATVFSGSAQFLALGLWATPLPIAGILVATLIVGLRHLLLGAALHPTLARLSRLRAYGSLFFLTDETWALTMRQFGAGGRDAAFLLGSGLTMAVAWFVGCVAGRAGGTWLIDPARWGFDFAFTAVFIALLIGCWRGRGDLLPWVVAAGVAIAAHRWLPGQLYIALGALAGSGVGVLRDGR